MQKTALRNSFGKRFGGQTCQIHHTNPRVEQRFANDARQNKIKENNKSFEDAPKKAYIELINELHKSFSKPRVFKRILMEFGRKYNIEVNRDIINMARDRMESLFFSEF